MGQDQSEVRDSLTHLEKKKKKAFRNSYWFLAAAHIPPKENVCEDASSR